MNSLQEHHRHSLRFRYRCFDRIGFIQPQSQPWLSIGPSHWLRHRRALRRIPTSNERSLTKWSLSRKRANRRHHDRDRRQAGKPPASSDRGSMDDRPVQLLHQQCSNAFVKGAQIAVLRNSLSAINDNDLNVLHDIFRDLHRPRPAAKTRRTHDHTGRKAHSRRQARPSRTARPLARARALRARRRRQYLHYLLSST
jgi:hypothetical protein